MDLLSLVVRTLRSQPYGFLATSSLAGPSVRLVQHLRVDDDATVWLGTSPVSRKISEVREQDDATYAVEDREAFAYAVVRGRADIVEDPTMRRVLWDPGLRAFFPGGPDGNDFVLLRIAPSSLEAMSFADSVHPDPYGLRAAVLTVT